MACISIRGNGIIEVRCDLWRNGQVKNSETEKRKTAMVVLWLGSIPTIRYSPQKYLMTPDRHM